MFAVLYHFLTMEGVMDFILASQHINPSSHIDNVELLVALSGGIL